MAGIQPTVTAEAEHFKQDFEQDALALGLPVSAFGQANLQQQVEEHLKRLVRGLTDGRNGMQDPQQIREMVNFDAKLESAVDWLLRAQAGDKNGQCNIGLHRQELQAHYMRLNNESLRWFNSELLPLIHGYLAVGCLLYSKRLDGRNQSIRKYLAAVDEIVRVHLNRKPQEFDLLLSDNSYHLMRFLAGKMGLEARRHSPSGLQCPAQVALEAGGLVQKSNFATVILPVFCFLPAIAEHTTLCGLMSRFEQTNMDFQTVPWSVAMVSVLGNNLQFALQESSGAFTSDVRRRKSFLFAQHAKLGNVLMLNEYSGAQAGPQREMCFGVMRVQDAEHPEVHVLTEHSGKVGGTAKSRRMGWPSRMYEMTKADHRPGYKHDLIEDWLSTLPEPGKARPPKPKPLWQGYLEFWRNQGH